MYIFIDPIIILLTLAILIYTYSLFFRIRTHNSSLSNLCYTHTIYMDNLEA